MPDTSRDRLRRLRRLVAVLAIDRGGSGASPSPADRDEHGGHLADLDAYLDELEHPPLTDE